MASLVTSEKTVVIIGAGIAGLCAAQAILDADKQKQIKVVVLEGRHRPGGRAYTTNMPGTALGVDLGASWIHSPINNPITEIASRVQATHVSVPMPFEENSFSAAYSA